MNYRTLRRTLVILGLFLGAVLAIVKVYRLLNPPTTMVTVPAPTSEPTSKKESYSFTLTREVVVEAKK